MQAQAPRFVAEFGFEKQTPGLPRLTRTYYSTCARLGVVVGLLGLLALLGTKRCQCRRRARAGQTKRNDNFGRPIL
jgi:hypothetical protein